MKRTTKNPVMKAILAASLAAVCLFSAPAWAAPSDDKQAEADAAYAQLLERQSFLDQTSNDYGQAVMEQEAAEAAVTEAQGRIDAATQRIAQVQTRLSDRAAYMYRQGTLSLFDVLLGSSSFSELVTNWNYLSIMNQSDANLIQESKDLRSEIQQQKVVLVEQQETATAKAAEAKQIMEDAQGVVNEIQAIYSSLSAEAAELLAQEEEAARQQQPAPSPSPAPNPGNEPGDGDGDDDDSGNEHPYQDDYAGRTDPDAVVGRAMSWLGNAEYVWGSVAPGKFDCSGFVSYCIGGEYRRLGTTYTFIYLPEVSNPRPGDICVNWEHCGIYLGNGEMIHCTSSRNNVVITPVWDSMIYVRW